MQIQPYLYFEGRCDEAIEFYCSALGATVAALHRYKDTPQPGMCPPGAENKVMHATLHIGDTEFYLSDGHCAGRGSFQGFSLSLNLDSEAEAQRQFALLSADGKVHMPLQKTFFSPAFGMLADRFGVPWMVRVW